MLVNLGAVYRLQKRPAESAQAFEKGVAILIHNWGPDDARLAGWLEQYALVQRAREEYAAAAKLDMEATRIRVLHTLR